MEIEQLILDFSEDRDNRGFDFAQERLRQKHTFLNWDKNKILYELNIWEEITRSSARKEKAGYGVVLGIAFLAIAVNLAVVFSSHFDDSTRRIFCFVAAAGVALFARFTIYLRSVATRTRDEANAVAILRREILKIS